MKNKLSSIRRTLLTSLFFGLILVITPVQVLGHGLGIDTSVPFYLNERDIAVSVQMIPSFIGEMEDQEIRIRAFDSNSDENIKNVNFLIGLFHEDEMIFKKLFFATDGELIITINPTNEDEITITGDKEPVIGGWTATEESPLEISGPVFSSGGLYHYVIEIRGIDEPTNILDNSIKYDAYVSVGDTSYHQQRVSNEDVTFKIKSYYDTITNFQYNPEENLIRFEMPFDWSEQNLSHVYFIHEEATFPKDFTDFLVPSYTGRVNGIDLFKSSIMVDDSSEEERIVHFMLSQDQIMVLKREQAKEMSEQLPNLMKFELAVSEKIEFPVVAFTKNEEFRVDLSWDPPIIEPDKNTKFIFTIRDPVSLNPLRQSSYDFVLIQNGKEIHRTSGVAEIGGYYEDYTFSEDRTGLVSVRLENIRGTGESTEIAVQVVPEFGSIALIILAVSIVSVIVVNKKTKTIPLL